MDDCLDTGHWLAVPVRHKGTSSRSARARTAGFGSLAAARSTWDDDKIIGHILDVAFAPDGPPVFQANCRWRVHGQRDDVGITVIVQPDGRIWSSWPDASSPGVCPGPPCRAGPKPQVKPTGSACWTAMRPAAWPPPRPSIPAPPAHLPVPLLRDRAQPRRYRRRPRLPPRPPPATQHRATHPRGPADPGRPRPVRSRARRDRLSPQPQAGPPDTRSQCPVHRTRVRSARGSLRPGPYRSLGSGRAHLRM